VGALDVKLETAYDAGCRTLIIPTENLYGEEGVERLSEALKRELQILTYEEWKNADREPFDHGLHLLQIVAVDHVVQAADIAFIDDRELKAAEELFTAHALTIRDTLASARRTVSPPLNLLYVKAPEELDLENIDNSFWEINGCILLVRPDISNEIAQKFTKFRDRVRVWEFDPAREDLASALQELEKSVGKEVTLPAKLSMFAPYFFLLKQGVCLEGFAQGTGFEGFRIFANNYTSQGLKIKRSKALLNRLYQHLSSLESEHLEACPFLISRDGIFMVDLSFIPEKYRLDEVRAETILNNALRKWLCIIDGAECTVTEPSSSHRGSSEKYPA
jgi:ATP-dependent Lon protease